jgi:hypothetical protein
MNQNEPGRQRGATTSAKTARPFRPTFRTPESAPRQVLASRQECQEGRCGCFGRLLFFEGEVVGVAGLAVVLDEARGR